MLITCNKKALYLLLTILSYLTVSLSYTPYVEQDGNPWESNVNSGIVGLPDVYTRLMACTHCTGPGPGTGPGTGERLVPYPFLPSGRVPGNVVSTGFNIMPAALLIIFVVFKCRLLPVAVACTRKWRIYDFSHGTGGHWFLMWHHPQFCQDMQLGHVTIYEENSTLRLFWHSMHFQLWPI